ncbi:unnamed protein product [Ascophyllum nodosum]
MPLATVTAKHTRGLNRTASGIKSVQDTLENQLKKLESEIQADEAGKQAFESLIFQLDERKKQLEKRIEANLHGIASSETDLGPFEDLYGAKKGEMASIYRDAKASHKEAINVLIKGFSYHPEFLRPQDSFHATPFVPK